MAAIITDQFRILSAKKFVEDVSSETNVYYAFVGLPNATEYNSDWNNNPLNPRDNFDQENDYWDSMIGLSRILTNNVRQVIRKNTWESGTTYDMYRHDISINNLSSTGKSSLYASNYFVVNRNLRVYICLDNGASPENNFLGNPSLDEPNFTDLEPRTAGTSGDGYIWKYLYSISPNDLVKFDSIFYVTTPENWVTNTESQAIINHAKTSGQLKIIKIKNRGTSVLDQGTYTGIPILGDGSGAEATLVINSQRKVDSITISSGGSGYTYGTVDLSGLIDENTIIEYPVFDVIIPPKGGHGYDIYRELGANAVLLYTRIESDSLNPDFITGNEISRFGIVENPTRFTGLGPVNSTEILSDTTVSALYALKLTGNINEASFVADSYITQTIETNKVAVGRVISYDKNTGVLKYWQDRRLVGFNTDGSRDPNSTYGYEMYNFTGTPASGGNLSIFNNGDDSGLDIDSSFGTELSPATIFTSINNVTYQLGQSFIAGTSNPEVEKYSGNVIYVDNRSTITRSQSQKEDIKVIIQF